MPNVVTVREAVQRAKQDGFPITEYMLRRWLKNGDIPYRSPGHKILIYYPHVIAYLKCEKLPVESAPPPATISGIRKVE